ncbi:copper chaperone PCu(A)C [Pseudoduganella plicata]|uniref:Copper chaperone PCu(A)C n=1 Tax=Pseudoduganella plicata TaxID=321984 RepID=A0A4P7BJD7_9BURK|nr:copper chaperone PCu(A)C [Pseudoduganella plicata]QBQ39026.1 copper chaperone PCu(A)C [Pseudoduganella plicata]GGY86616.1 transporter [Pseudoduganella plicata]
MKRIIEIAIAAAVAAALSLPAVAQVTVKDPWARATVPAAKSSGAFMQVQSKTDARLVGVSSPAAGVAELHRMSMQDNRMTMAPVEAIDLPAGKTVALASGGYHIMLMGLTRQLKEGETIPVTLVVEGKDRKREKVEVQVPVRPLTYSPPAAH